MKNVKTITADQLDQLLDLIEETGAVPAFSVCVEFPEPTEPGFENEGAFDEAPVDETVIAQAVENAEKTSASREAFCNFIGTKVVPFLGWSAGQR